MPVDFTPTMIAVASLQAAFFLSGLWALWHFQFSQRAREQLRDTKLDPSWRISATAFVQTALCVIAGAILMQVGLAQLIRRFFPALAQDSDWWTVIVGSGLHLGALLGILFSRLLPDTLDPLPLASAETPPQPPTRLSGATIMIAGIITFVAAMPLVDLIAIGWQSLLELLHVPVEKQPLIDIFSKTHAPARIATMIFFAVIIAPLAEELIFRAGLFRFLRRARLPRWTALSISALVFAAVHGNLLALPPLFILGLIFALAYERTGRILVPVIAHGLFNLNTIVLLLAGVPA